MFAKFRLKEKSRQTSHVRAHPGDPKGGYKDDDDSFVTSHPFGLFGNKQ
jgi:hypothetical protein